MKSIELSFVIPVFNGAMSIARVVGDIESRFSSMNFEIVLVNDFSRDESDSVCRSLVQQYQGKVIYLELARNFGEHNAVLCGLKQTTGQYVAVLDDDGQNPPSEVWPMYTACKDRNVDVVYGKYADKKHHWFRNLGSTINDRAANVMLKKPKEIYLSSFKVISRVIVDEICRYRGAFPYIDGIIFRSTQRIQQIVVQHELREDGESNYNLRRLVRLWLNMFINHSIWPLRIASLLGFVTAILGVVLVCTVIYEKLTTPYYPIGMPFLLVTVILFAGVQLIMLGVIGEYLGRLFLDHGGQPQSVVRAIVKY